VFLLYDLPTHENNSLICFGDFLPYQRTKLSRQRFYGYILPDWWGPLRACLGEQPLDHLFSTL